tara:strand:+ start:394 stop:540 length:147 start_codon:yes stop_codon:yes gene_type:complete
MKDNIFALILINMINDKYLNRSLNPTVAMEEIGRALRNYSSITEKDYK